MAKIYIASKELNDDPTQRFAEHSYYVYDPDGDPHSGDERIIRGGNVGIWGDGRYIIEVDRLISQSRDTLGDDDPFLNRNYTTLFESDGAVSDQDVANKWAGMVAVAETFGSYITDPDSSNYSGQSVVDLPESDYALFLQNCHALTGTIGRENGFSINAQTVKSGGDAGAGNPIIAANVQFWGIDGHFMGVNDGSIALYSGISAIFDQGGSDTYEYDPALFSSQDGPIYIFEDSNSSTLDKIVIKDLSPEHIRMERVGNDLAIYIPGDIMPSIVIKGQFAGAVPKINTLWVEPAGGGTPSVLPLNNPNDFPTQIPQPLGPWAPGTREPFNDGEDVLSPLALDLTGAGIQLAALNGPGSVYWNITQTDFAHASGWIAGDFES